jgi:hypothetical protein
MAAIEYLVPGGAYVNEDTATREFLIPGGGYLNETSVEDVIVSFATPWVE